MGLESTIGSRDLNETMKIREWDEGRGTEDEGRGTRDEGRGTRESSSRVSPQRKKHGYFSLRCI